jgi:hypothetical protein
MGAMMACCAGAIVAACDVQAAEIADLKRQLAERTDDPVAEAERDALREALVAVMGILDKDGGFRTPRQQKAMRGAKALIAETGR